ncbi:MAG: pyridoxal-phosphate dependent enzyme [Bacteroidota bacterium]
MHQTIEQAYQTIRAYIGTTSLVFSPKLSELTGAKVWLKLENEQRSGSFKLRGVMNKILSMPRTKWQKKFVAVSTGNHAAAFAYAARHFELEGEIFLPETVTRSKWQALKNYGLPLKRYGKNSLETELYASNYARENDYVLIHPYNDLAIVAGQGTVALELCEQLDQFDAVLVPVGGGGLISGISSYLHHARPQTKVIACQPLHSPEMYESVKAGKIIEMENLPTLSDATAGGIEPGAVTFDFCQQYVQDYELLSEAEIRQGILFLLEHHHLLIEGGAALSVAALLKNGNLYAGQTIVGVLTGKKLSMEKLKTIMADYSVEKALNT